MPRSFDSGNRAGEVVVMVYRQRILLTHRICVLYKVPTIRKACCQAHRSCDVVVVFSEADGMKRTFKVHLRCKRNISPNGGVVFCPDAYITAKRKRFSTNVSSPFQNLTHRRRSLESERHRSKMFWCSLRRRQAVTQSYSENMKLPCGGPTVNVAMRRSQLIASFMYTVNGNCVNSGSSVEA